MNSFDLNKLIFTALAVLITLTIHEYAHGYVAYKLGDNTARNLGRLTLNPIKHLDPYGALCMVFFRFGWAKPVPINPRNFKNPRKGFALCAIAGPLANIILAFISAFLYVLCDGLINHPSSIQYLYNLQYNVLLFLWVFHAVNVGLGVFNLIPIPPFDGSRILNLILPPKAYFAIMRHERKIYWGVILWLFLGNYVYSALLSIPFVANNVVLSGIASVFSLSMHLSNAIDFLSGVMIKFWTLLIF